MGTLNSAFFFVIDKIIELQAFFLKEAWAIGRYVLFIAIASAAINYALTGAGLKENIIKIGKAVVFFVMIMTVYPQIIGFITSWTFEKAQASTYLSIERYLDTSRSAIADTTYRENTTIKETYGARNVKSEKISEEKDPMKYFSSLLVTREYRGMEYTCVAPAAALEIILLIAGECIRYSEETPKIPAVGLPTDFGRVIIGLICGFFVIFTGVLAVLEYLMAFMEYMFITSVGIILFPLSIWEGSKFMAEKLIGAIMGFFIKLLFCNICIFLMLYGFISLARGYSETPFTGRPDEIVVVVFISLLFFFLCKSAPALAQSLLTGTPSLNASGAIAAAGGAIAGAGAALGIAGKAGSVLAGGTAKAAFGGAGALTQAASAAQAVSDLGGTAGQQAGAFMSSIGGSAKEALKSSGGDLTRSLIGGRSGGRSGASGGSGAGINRHSQRQHFLEEKNEDGTKKTFGEYLAGRREAGTDAGIDYLAKKEAQENRSDVPPDETS
jgi:hypothetical protein